MPSMTQQKSATLDQKASAVKIAQRSHEPQNQSATTRMKNIFIFILSEKRLHPAYAVRVCRWAAGTIIWLPLRTKQFLFL